jgi:hypothetical protein
MRGETITENRVSLQILPDIPNRFRISEADAILKVQIKPGWSKIGRRNDRARVISNVNLCVKPGQIDNFTATQAALQNAQRCDI